ncbi:MAG: hypothetical protein NTW30_05710 [Candidatus Aenigmarchaeota archaeon]|nr:hypothetical protein [Candidatus Aenigmarchaeota archaeon]
MQKIGILLIVIIIISIGCLSGCTNEKQNEKIDYKNLDWSKAEWALYSHYEPYVHGDPESGKVHVNLYLKLPEEYFPIFNNHWNLTVSKELTFILHGNGHYCGGDSLMTYRNDIINLNEFHRNIKVFNWSCCYEDGNEYGFKLIPAFSIDQELQNAMLEETAIQWSVSGQVTFYAPENQDEISLSFENVSCIQTDFSQ